MNDMAVCESMVPAILASVDDTLDAPGRMRLAAHVAECPACRRALDEQKAVKQLLATLPAVAVSRHFAARVRQRVTQSIRWWELADWRVWTLRLAPVAALLALLAWMPFASETTLSNALDAWATAASSTADGPLRSILNPEIDARTLLLTDTFERAPGGTTR